MYKSSYLNLSNKFYSLTEPQRWESPHLIAYNEELAKQIGLELDSKDKELLKQLFSGNQVAPGPSLSLAYAGHQFGQLVNQLGDGRAVVIGESIAPGGIHYDIQLKGSGKTVFSRNGDGLSSLGPVIREYIVSEAMNNLGVTTTRALAAVNTGEEVYRDGPTPGGVFTRVARSLVRVGTFEYFALRGDYQAVKELADHCIDRLFSKLKYHEDKYLSFFKAVVAGQVDLVTSWLSLGFIHGVMNTDNTSISGETIDYGPCAFLDEFDQNKVFSFIDKNGRYAYGNQGPVLQWNLSRLAECLLPLIHADLDEAIKICEKEIEATDQLIFEHWQVKMAKKLGLDTDDSIDVELIHTWLKYLQKEKLDFTLAFRFLPTLLGQGPETHLIEYPQTDLFHKFFNQWKIQIEKRNLDFEEIANSMNQVNPLFIPRNHLVEKAIQSAYQGDYYLFHSLNKVLKNPFEYRKDDLEFAKAPQESEKVCETFCGT